MSAASAFWSVCLRAYNGRYLSHLSSFKNNCNLCKRETLTRSFSTQRDICAFRFCRHFMSRIKVRHLHLSCIYL